MRYGKISRPVTTRQPRRMLAAALGFVLVLGIPHAFAADDEEDLTFEQKLMRQLLGGFMSPGADIDYRERSPLVVPPSRDLPSPEQSATVVNNPSWPVDADIKRRKEESKKKREARRSPLSDNEEGRALRPNELNVGSKPGAGRVAPGRTLTENEQARAMKPNELGYVGGLWSNMFGTTEEKPVPFAGEPPRASLIEPPTGYRTPSPSQPYGVLGKEKYEPKAVRVEDIPTGETRR